MKRVLAVAAELWRRLAAPGTKKALSCAFKRDITVFDWRTGATLELMGLSSRTFPRKNHLPGYVAIVSSTRDMPTEEAVDVFLARGGTVIVEGNAVHPMAKACGVLAKQPKQLEDGPVSVRGPGVDALFPARFRPLFWADGDASCTKLSPARTAVVHVSSADGTPIVQTMATRGGTFAHIGCVTSAFQSSSAKVTSKVTCEPRAIAKELGVPAEGILGSDEALPEEPTRAALTMMAVLADIIARGLPQAPESQARK